MLTFPNILFLSGVFLLRVSATPCPIDGPLLPRPRNISNSKFVLSATQKLTSVLDSALNGSINSGWSIPNTSFSVGLVNIDSPKPFWQYHHRASANSIGSDVVDEDSQYLVGSISKLISELVLLRTGVDLDTPVTDYLPQLKNETSKISWQDITLGSFADHLSGIPPNFGFSEYYYLLPLLEQLGFPPLSPDEFPNCGVIGLNEGCSRDELLQNVLDIHPVAPPFERPVYSQLSLTILFYALEVATGNNFSQLLTENVIQPFNLTNTGLSPGNTSRAVIPPVDSSWGSDYGDNAPGGGLYSSLSDLSTLVNLILTKRVLSTESSVNQWLKPHSTTSSPNTLVGRPWEIFRSTNLTPKYPHTIDIYSKSGGAYGYISQVSVIDQYGIGIIVLTAGDPNAMTILLDFLLDGIVGALEDETRSQSEKYTGNWNSGGQVRTEMALKMDSGPGLKLGSLSRNGSSIVDGFVKFWVSALAEFGPLDPDLRLYPADIRNEGIFHRCDSVEDIEVIREDWRITFSTLPNTAERTGSELPGQGALKDFCTSWQLADWVYYGGEPVDRVVFILEKGTLRVLAVDIPFLGISLQPEDW